MKSKHITAKGLNNSLIGFFERIVKPYVTRNITDNNTNNRLKTQMDFIGCAGSMYCYTKKLPIRNRRYYYQYWRDESYGNVKNFTIDRNGEVAFDSTKSTPNKAEIFKSTSSSNSNIEWKSLGNLSPLTNYTFPFITNNSSNESCYIKPGDGSVNNIFYVPEYSPTEEYSAEIKELGALKINDASDIASCSLGTFSKVEDDPTRCAFYKIDYNNGDRLLKVGTRIMEMPEVRTKLAEVYETTDEELDSKINTVRIIDSKRVSPASNYYISFDCILCIVNKNKLMVITCYNTGSSYNSNQNTTRQVELFDIEANSLFAYKVNPLIKGTVQLSRETSYVTQYYFEGVLLFNKSNNGGPVTTTAYRLIVDPSFTVASSSPSKGDTVFKFEEIVLPTPIEPKYVIGITEEEPNVFSRTEYETGRNYIVTYNKGLIKLLPYNSNKAPEVSVIMPDLLKDFISDSSSLNNTKKVLLKMKNGDGVSGFVCFISRWSTFGEGGAYCFYSPDAIHWFFASDYIENSYRYYTYSQYSNSWRLSISSSSIFSAYNLNHGYISYDSNSKNQMVCLVMKNKDLLYHSGNYRTTSQEGEVLFVTEFGPSQPVPTIKTNN